MSDKIYMLALSNELTALPDNFDGIFNSVNTLLEEVKTPSAILIDGLKPEDDNILKEAFAALCQLRSSEIFYAAPIYFAKSMGYLDKFVDGVESTTATILTDASNILFKLGSIPRETNAANTDLRLLTFLFCRDDAYFLSPQAVVGSPWIYEYPVACLIGGFADAITKTIFGFDSFTEKKFSEEALRSSAEWLASMWAQGFLTAIKLVDRIRICPYCNTGNLNYVDSCPICGNIDFEKKRMIHCFTCGHVAPEETFKNAMMFVCPRCNVNLRHIGTDYDRPLESHVCNGCGERFIEPDIKADCFKCRQKTAPENLTARQLYNYSLTAKGRNAAQFGVIDFEFSLFDENRNVLPVYFYQMTDWLLELKLRYSDEDFSLLCIKIIGVDAIECKTGIIQTKKLIDELFVRIRELVQSTDITTNTCPNTFWVLLPRTNQKGGEVLASKVEKLAEMVDIKNTAHIDIIAKCFSIPIEYAQKGPIAEILLAEYEAILLDSR